MVFEAIYAAFILLSVTYFLYHVYAYLGSNHIPSNIPWASGSKGWLSRVGANMGDAVNGKANIEAGYEQYSKRGRTFVLPRVAFKPVVVLPHSHLGWMTAQPDAVLSAKALQVEHFSFDYVQARYVFDDAATSFLHEAVVRRELTRRLGGLLPAVAAELGAAIGELWGADTESFREVSVVSDLAMVFCRSTNLVYVGEPLCRDAEFNRLSERYARSVGNWGVIFQTLCPESIRPLLGPLVLYPVRRIGRKFHAKLRPLVESRIRDLAGRRTDTHEKPAGASDTAPEPNDFLQWLIRTVASDNSAHRELDPERLCTRMAFMEMAAIHTTSMTFSHVLLDLASGDAARVGANWAALRAEAEQALLHGGGGSSSSNGGNGGNDGNGTAANPPRWNSSAFSRLTRADSAIRESMRLNLITYLAVGRTVVDPKGITLPTGEHVPPGTLLATTALQQHDDEYFEGASEYRPFRFVNASDDANAGAAVEEATLGAESGETTTAAATVVLSKGNQSITSTGETFTNFGAGKHVCPGRFFAAQEMKLLLAYIAVNYEIETLPERPGNFRFSMQSMPPLNAKLRVRRRKLSAGDRTS